ncbi:C-type lectin BML-2-like [Centruroides sculpturatus]|nr:C-type lectin BML-2-like [Centruroides sculpturatus]
MAEGITLTECLTLCLSHRRQQPNCMAFNYNNSTCYLLNTYLCDPDYQHQLVDVQGGKYFDLLDYPYQEDEFRRSRMCLEMGRCSVKCPKYKLFETPKTFEDAKATCREENAVVAMPMSDQDHEDLILLLKSKKLIRGWVGVMKTNDTFVYVDGRSFPPGFNKWGKEQPNNSGGEQNCAEMLQEMAFLWNDYECDKLDPFICQYVTS